MNVTTLMRKVRGVYARGGLRLVKDRALSYLRQVDRNDYEEWIRRYDTLTNSDREKLRARAESFSHRPLISVVMPTYNSTPSWLTGAIESVRKQIYPHWELCIADDASTTKTVRPLLERYATDPRIAVTFREQNGHISAACNTALELATGEWIVFLDHDDLLSEHALYYVADAIDKQPDSRLIYSDQDKIDERGRRFSPYFKCDWNIDLFYSHNLVTHLSAYRKDVLEDIGNFTEGMDGAQDYDLTFRCIERIDPRQIHHIPRVLYHWRAHSKSTARSADAKPYAMMAGERALNAHFARRKMDARAELIGHGYRIHYTLRRDASLASVIILTKDGLNLLQRCVRSVLEKTTYPNYEVLIIDNGSGDRSTLRYLEEMQATRNIRVLRDDRAFNFSALNNAAAKEAKGKFLVLLNNDVEVISPDWLSEMVSIASQQGVGAVGARLWYPNGTLQHGGVILGIGGVAGHSHKHLPRENPGYWGRASLAQSFSAVTAACMVIRREIYEEIGGLDELNLPVALNDVDFCLRLREAGYRNVWTPFAELYHHESATRGYEDTAAKQARLAGERCFMRERWGEQLLHDPAYNPNLTLNHEDFSLSWPPRMRS